MEQARICVENIDQKNLQFIKSLASPPEAIKKVANLLVILKPSADSPSEADGWAGARQMMNNPAQFVLNLKGFGEKD